MSFASQLSIRSASPSEVGLALDWAAAEGWNPGLHDAGPFAAADSQGFLLGFVGDAPVALISAVRYDGGFGFVGFYIVQPEWRGRGHGWAIWQAAISRLAGCNVALDGVPAQQDNYRRSGFKLAWRNIRFEGVAWPADTVESDGVWVGLRDVPRSTLARFDRRFFPAERSEFLQQWIAQPGTSALGIVRGGELAGCGVIRPCRNGYKIGPLFADTPQDAEALFVRLQSGVPAGEPIFLDVPECNPEALALAERHGMKPSFETARMYTGPVPDISVSRTYGITSFELG